MFINHPQYIAAAYKKAVLDAFIDFVSRKYLATSNAPPPAVLIAEEVPRNISEVPQEAVQEFIMDLADQRERIVGQLKAYRLVKVTRQEAPPNTLPEDEAPGKEKKDEAVTQISAGPPGGGAAPADK